MDVKIAPGSKEFDRNEAAMTMRLLKTLYGLNQSLFNWRGAADEHIVRISLKGLNSEPRVYVYLKGGVIDVRIPYAGDV